MWFIKITKAASFESVEVFRKDPCLALYFSLSSLMIFRPLCLLPSAVFFMLTIWPFSPPPPRSPLRWRPQKELCIDWSAGLSTGVFLSIRANVRPPSSQWIPTKLTSNPTSSYSAPASVLTPLQLFLGSSSTSTLSFSKLVSSLKAKFFPRLKALRCISASSWGPSKESLSLLYQSFLRSLLTYASPGWFPFLSATNFTKLERLHRAASRAIPGCLSFSSIPLLLPEASLPPLRVTLTHFTLLSYERALRLPTSFPISGLARLVVKPRHCRSSWRALASTDPLMLPSTCCREALLACPPYPPWNLPSFTVESTLSTPCSRSDPPHSRQGAALTHLDSLPVMIWCFGLTALFVFLLARTAPAFLPTALSVALRPLFPFRQVQCAQVFPLKPAAFCTLCAGLGSINKSAISLLLLSDSRSVLLSQTLWQIWQELSSLPSCSIRLQRVPGHSFLPGTTRLLSWPDGVRYLRPPQSLVVSLLSSYLGLEAYCLIEAF